MTELSLSNALNVLGPTQTPQGLFEWEGEGGEDTIRMFLRNEKDLLTLSVSKNKDNGKDLIQSVWRNIEGGWAFEEASIGGASVSELAVIKLAEQYFPSMSLKSRQSHKIKMGNR